MILGYAERLLAINLKHFAIIAGKGHTLLMLIVFVGYDNHKGLIVSLTINGNLSVYSLCLSSLHT